MGRNGTRNVRRRTHLVKVMENTFSPSERAANELKKRGLEKTLAKLKKLAKEKFPAKSSNRKRKVWLANEAKKLLAKEDSKMETVNDNSKQLENPKPASDDGDVDMEVEPELTKKELKAKARKEKKKAKKSK